MEVGLIRHIQGLDTAYWGFLGVGTTLDIFQNIILIPYLEYGVLILSGYGVLSLFLCGLCHKQALGYQNSFHLKKAQRIQPTLYYGSVIAKEHVVIFVTDDEEILILEEESQSKMLDKQNDPILIEKKITISPIDYSKLNKIKEDFGKRSVTQKELSVKQAFWLKYSSISETSVMSQTPVRIEALSELPKGLGCSVEKNVFGIQVKQLRIDNDQLLNQIMSQKIMHIVANSVDICDVKKSCVNDCKKCPELELFKKKDFVEKEAYDKLVKSYSNLE
ncbi:hypothetical protein Tco_1077596, partial [Tanacetum coccineum]